MNEVSDKPITLGAEIESGPQGNESIVVSQYTPPLDGTQDEFDAVDMRVARYVAEILVKTYNGYPWSVTSEVRQGVVMFRLPDLMGESLQYVINLRQFGDLTKELVVRCGGELLERMKLPRSAIGMDLYRAARQNLHTFDFGDLKRRS